MLDPSLVVERQALPLEVGKGQILPAAAGAVESLGQNGLVDLGAQLVRRTAENEQAAHRGRGNLQKIVGEENGGLSIALT